MQVRVRLFAIARERAGAPEIALDLPEGATVAALKAAIRSQTPALAPLLPSLMFAVDAEYAVDETVIPPGAEVAAIPPVSGGSGIGGPP